MFGFIAGIPSRLKHLFSKFKKHLSKPQYENFCRAQIGMIVAGQGEHDIKSINSELLLKFKNSYVKLFSHFSLTY